MDDAEQAHQALHAKLVDRIGALQSRLDHLEQMHQVTIQRVNAHTAELERLAKQSLQQNARLDVLHEELLALKRRFGFE